MSKQSKTLDTELSVVSRLWYTASVIVCHPNVSGNNVTELESLIRSVIVSQNDAQYRWISYKLLSKIISNKHAHGEEDVRLELVNVQLCNALKLLCNVPSYIQQNPLRLLGTSDASDVERKKIIDLLVKDYQENPSVVCWILNNLLSSQCDNIQGATDSLQELCISTLKKLINDSCGQDLTKLHMVNNTSCKYKCLGNLICILTKLDALGCNQNEQLAWLYPALFEICNIRDVEFALYVRNNGKILTEWLSYMDEIQGRFIDSDTMTNAVKICNAILRSQTDTSILLHEKELLLRIIRRRRHWLLDILDLCCTLIVNENYNNVRLFMSQLSHGCLWPILLLKVLQDCLKENNDLLKNWEHNIVMCNVFKHLLEMCNFMSWHNSTLSKLDTMLRNHVKVVEWILVHKKADSYDENNSSTQLRSPTTEPIITVKCILELLQNFSALTVLKKTINLHETNYTDVRNLLKDISPEENTFLAYCSLAISVKAILLCEYYDTEHKHITKYLQEVESYLKTLSPLSVRLETIENIFCLLFLRQENFDDRARFSEKNNINTSNEYSDLESTSIEHSCAGFICNKYAVREILYHLQNSILAADTDYAKEKGESSLAQDSDPIQQKITAITKNIAEANWRLDLCTSTHFIKNVGTFDGTYKHSDLTRKYIDVANDKVGFPHCSKNSTPFYQEDDSSTYEFKKRSDSSSDTTQAFSSSRPRKRTRNAVSTSEILTLRDNSQRSSFINFMLASNESLVLQCLQKGSFEKAEEVIELSDMKNSHLDEKVRFSKAMQFFRQCLFTSDNQLETTDLSKENPKCSTLESIRYAAQEGIQSSRHTNQLETFLASQETHLRVFTSDGTQTNEILTLSALDLALTMSRTYKIANSFCDVALKHLKLCKSLENTEHAHFFSKICLMINENKNEMSVSNILCDAQIPLSTKEWEEEIEFWNNLTIACNEFSECDDVNSNVDNTLVNATYFRELKILRKITSICGYGQKYLQNVYSHLQLLHPMIVTLFDGTQTFSMTELLKVPLHYYFGHQIFDLHIEPHKLESTAHNLQVNLVHTILANTCPNIPCYNGNFCTTNKLYTGCVILNESHCSNADLEKNVSDSPNQCIARILEELLRVLHNLSENKSVLTRSDIKNIAKQPDMQAALGKTSRLTFLDLSELSVGNETMAFFINLWNVMFIHTAVTVWSNDASCNRLNHDISLMSTGYIIGDLGLVTLAALRSKLLDGLVSSSKYFKEIDELNEAAWQDLDLIQNPKVLFAIANEFCRTPRIRVFEAKTLDNDLDEAARDYMNQYSSDQLRLESNSDLKQDVTEALSDINDKCRFNITLQHLKSDEEDKDSNKALLMATESLLLEYEKSVISCVIVLSYSSHINVESSKTVDSTVTTYRQNRTVKENLLQYLEGHCWLLSYLVQRMQNKHSAKVDTTDDMLKRTVCLENLLTSSWISKLKLFFDDNETLAGIHDLVTEKKLWLYFEKSLENNEWAECLDIVNALPDSMLMGSFEIQYFKDKLLSHVITNSATLSPGKMLQLLFQIKDVHILTQTILSNISEWHINVCEFALLHALRHKDKTLPLHCKFDMNEILRRVTIFRKMLPYCTDRCNGTWYDVAYCTQKIDPFCIIKSLTNADKFELCLEWLECQAFSQKVQSSITQEFLIGLLRTEEQDFKCTSKLLQALPLSQSVKMCKGALKKLEAPNVLQFLGNYLLQHCKATGTTKYRRTLVGIDILKYLDFKERILYIHLIKEPLLMLEQLLMNCKFDTIQRILSATQKSMEQADISLNSFDETIIFYAKKSLDFRVCLQRESTDSKLKIVQHSSNVEAESNEFVMPVSTPTKEKWIPNDKARECSCCKAVIFSMFNRRHHCRRCGRVVCAVCSQHRMQVSGYPSSVLVRVCDDCKRQTAAQMRAVHGGVPSTPSSEAFDYWRLTRDEAHNRTIREEFSFEYAPSISLCLSILNLHSDHKAYTNVLLDRCDEMKCLLRPVSDGKVNPEVDHAVIIKMIHSLLVAAKVKCAKLGFNTGLAHCDRFLSQVDLIATLARSDCLDLIPSGDLHERALRKLRDLLTEKEQWTLALDVSTKSGLDTQGVWAAWGKACLKVGAFEQAREKFLHCLDKISDDDFEDWVLLSYPRDSIATESCNFIARGYKEVVKESCQREKQATEPPTSKRSEPVRSRPVKDPPLLSEILQILENLSVNGYFMQRYPYDKNKTVYEISNIINNLKATSQGHFTVKNSSSAPQTVYQQESLYYLLTYGSYNSILENFIRYEEFHKCLAFVLENDLDPEIFFNGVYIYSLKNGSSEKLCEVMRTRDPTLLTWRKYLIHICHNLERRQYLHCLYQLQLFMKDSVRAAMTCIRFYINDTGTYTDLCSRAQFLLDAQAHLESELQVSSLTRKRRKSTGSSHSNSQSVLTMEMEPCEIDRHINTISRQMEIAKFLGNAEREGRSPNQFLNIFPDIDCDKSHALEMPTLFGNQQQKIHLAVLAILCGRDVEEGFGIAFRIMQDYNLPSQKVYSLAGHALAIQANIPAIEQLIKCCRSSGAPNSHVISDYVLTHCVKLLLNRSYEESELALKSQIGTLIRLIRDVELKIIAYIDSKQLKAAYLLAVKYSRTQDIRKILKESDRLGQHAIKTICMKWLQQQSKR